MKYTSLLLIFLIPSILFAQPSVKWQKCLGGTSNEEPGGILQTADGGYLMTGQTHSSNGDITSNHGNYDLWVAKLDAQGAIEWQKTYGGSEDDGGGAIIPGLDGGYIIAAATNSIDGDLQGLRSDNTQTDIWILKIDSLGNILWQKIFGGSGYDAPSSIVLGGEGQYIISAVTTSTDGDVKGYHGGSGGDIWVFTMSETGALGSQKMFGGTKDDEGGIIQTDGGGYALVGTTFSRDGDISGRNIIDTTSADAWLVKLDKNMDIIWQKTYGGSAYDGANDLIQTLDHGYAIAGWTSSSDNGDVQGIHDAAYYGDAWIVKVDSIGKMQWQKCLGGSRGDFAFSILQASDSGYIVSGNTTSDDDDVVGFHGSTDCWIFKLSKNGDLVWQETLGGSGSDANISSGIMPTSDSGFLVATTTWSNDGDVQGLHGDSADIWLVKLSEDLSEVKNIGNFNNASVSFYPNPATNKTTISYDLETASEVNIGLFNPLGEKLRTVLNTKEESGNHIHNFDISDLPSGSYFFRIEMEGKSVLKSVELIK